MLCCQALLAALRRRLAGAELPPDEEGILLGVTAAPLAPYRLRAHHLEDQGLPSAAALQPLLLPSRTQAAHARLCRALGVVELPYTVRTRACAQVLRHAERAHSSGSRHCTRSGAVL